MATSDEVNSVRSRQYLDKGPPSAVVKGVELIQETHGANDREVQQALKGGGDKYEVRDYKKT